MASRTFPDLGPVTVAAFVPALSELVAQRGALVVTVDELKRKRAFMPPDDYSREIERVLIELARVSRKIRTGS